MPANLTIQIPPNTWTRVTSAAVTGLRLQSLGLEQLAVLATAGTDTPVSAAGALILRYQDTILPEQTLASLFPGVAGANHVWVISRSGGEVSVSHA